MLGASASVLAGQVRKKWNARRKSGIKPFNTEVHIFKLFSKTWFHFSFRFSAGKKWNAPRKKWNAPVRPMEKVERPTEKVERRQGLGNFQMAHDCLKRNCALCMHGERNCIICKSTGWIEAISERLRRLGAPSTVWFFQIPGGLNLFYDVKFLDARHLRGAENSPPEMTPQNSVGCSLESMKINDFFVIPCAPINSLDSVGSP